MAIPWNSENASHLLRRSGFGARPKDVAKAVKAGLDATVAALLKPDKTSDKLPKSVDSLERLQAWWIRRMVLTKSPLTEKLLLFWHNHFATGFRKVQCLEFMHGQNRTLRKSGLGKFRDLLKAVARDPAMIVWLDSETNLKESPNKNFARELQELFTTGKSDALGAPLYSESDVDEAARAFTGWRIAEGKFFFDADEHDFGVKSFKGQTGAFDGDDILDLLAADPATPRRLAMKLFSYFAFEVALSDPVVDELAAIYAANDTAIAPVLDHLFKSDVFYSAAAKGEAVKSPAEFLVGSLRLLGAKLHGKGDELGERVQELGQSLFDPPSVFGWKEGLAWASTAGLLGRASVGSWIADARGNDHPVKYAPKKLLGPGIAKLTAEGAVARIVDALGPVTLGADTATALAVYAKADENGDPVPEFELDGETIDRKVRGLVALLLAVPEFQLS